MKKVIDSSALRSESLRQFLETNPANTAIITDHLTMEMFKGDGQTNIHRSLKFLAAHPRQVVVLKSTPAIVKLRPRANGLHGRFVNETQTAGFARYCRVLFGNTADQGALALDRERKQLAANLRYERLKGSVETIRATIQKLKNGYNDDELKALRRKEVIPGDFWNRFSDDLFNSTIVFHREVPGMPNFEGADIIYTFAFRYTLCAYARAVDWISEGGYENTPEAKLMNDYTDMAYAAYATFYDGLLTEDKKLEEIYTFAMRLMRRVYLKAATLSADEPI